MTHIFIEENSPTDWSVRYGDTVFHCDEYKQAAELALMIAERLGLM